MVQELIAAVGDRHRDEPAADLALRLGARPGRARRATSRRSRRRTWPRRSRASSTASIQICGALGVSGDAPLARLSNEMRPFRIYDGPTETHHWAIARRALATARASAARDASRRDATSCNRAEAAAARREPLLVLEPLAAFLDAAGLGDAAAPGVADRRRPLQRHLPAATRRARVVLRRPPRGRCRRRPTTCCARRACSARSAGRRARPGDPRGLRRPGRDRRAVLPDGARRRRRRSAEHLPARSPTPRAARGIGEELVDALVELHAVDPRPPELEGFGRPTATWSASSGASAACSSRTRHGTLPELRPSRRGSRTTSRDAAHAPSSTATTASATSCSPPARRGCVAMLDWEMATLGDPLADLGYLTATWARPRRPGEPDRPPVARDTRAGLPDRPTACRRYAERTGRVSTRSAGTRCSRSGRRRSSSRGAIGASSPGRPTTPTSPHWRKGSRARPRCAWTPSTAERSLSR